MIAIDTITSSLERNSSRLVHGLIRILFFSRQDAKIAKGSFTHSSRPGPSSRYTSTAASSTSLPMAFSSILCDLCALARFNSSCFEQSG
ncbi:MAG: hypothetical protein MUP74_01620 [Desulfobacterales bacterium]|nr:hypothetical protein [Desulfobacterales bacterium]